MRNISIIVPTYNRSKLILRTVRSVVTQTAANWELIIVDDGSTDDTAEVIKPFLNEKVRYVSQENSGANTARNHGARLARYDLIAFLDSDDELLPTWVEEFFKVAEGADVICCGAIRVHGDVESETLPKSLGIVFNNIVGKFLGGSYAISREMFFSIGAFDEELKSGQHTELSLRLLPFILTGKLKLKNIMKPLIKIHVHEGPRIRTSSPSKMLGAIRIMEKHKGIMAQYPHLRRTYSRIVTYQAFKQKQYWQMLRAGLVYFESSFRLLFYKDADRLY